jgi:serine protease AprX
VAALGPLTGKGVGIAVIDSGLSRHHGLRHRVVASVDFTRGGSAEDAYGHGTHVAGVAAGGAEYRGIAPGAHVVNLKVLGKDGTGETSDVIAAIDWAIEHKATYGLRVINLSLGRPVFDSYRDDPLCQAVERAFRAGLVVVAAAGNFGKLEDGTLVVGTVTSPGNSPYALTVGALDTRGTAARSDDVVAAWSSRGPTAMDHLLKPDLVAPGTSLVSLLAPGRRWRGRTRSASWRRARRGC